MGRLRKEREERNKAEGELKMLQHWKINNPGARNGKRERQGMLASKLLQQQLKEKQEIEEEKKREEEEHHKRAMEEEQRKIREAQKDFLEQHILKRREAEVKRLSYWSETSQYYDKLAKNAERYNGLASEETRRQSLEAANKEELGRQKKANLSIRREKLRKLLEKEKKGHLEEMAGLPSGQQPITDLRMERERLRKEREERNKAEGELKMLQHWK